MNTTEPKSIETLEGEASASLLGKINGCMSGEGEMLSSAYYTLQKAILLRKVNDLASREAIEGLVDRAVDRAFEKAKDERASNAGGEQ